MSRNLNQVIREMEFLVIFFNSHCHGKTHLLVSMFLQLDKNGKPAFTRCLLYRVNELALIFQGYCEG